MTLEEYCGKHRKSIERSIGIVKGKNPTKEGFAQDSDVPKTPRSPGVKSRQKPKKITPFFPVRRSLDDAVVEYVPKVDPYFIVDKGLTADVVFALDNEMVLYMWGPKGTCKTHTLMQMAALSRIPVIRLNCRADMRSSHFIGRIAGRQGSTFWKDGVLPKAMKYGAWLLVDEVDIAPPHILNVLQAVMDSRVLTIEDTGGVVRAHKNFRIIFDANTSGAGDPSGQYHGTHPLNESFRDRVGMWVKTSHPTESFIKNLVTRKFPALPEEEVARVAQLASKVNAGSSTVSEQLSVSIRRVLAMAMYLDSGYSWRRTLEFAIYNNVADKYELRAFKEVVKSIGL